MIRWNQVFVFAFLSIGTSTTALASQCQLKTSDSRSQYYVCDYAVPGVKSQANQKVNLLYTKGTATDAALFHGYALADQIVKGTIPEILRKRDEGLSTFPPEQRDLLLQVTKCVSEQYRTSVSYDFLTIHNALFQGLKNAGHNELSEAQLLDASFAVELSIFFEGLNKTFHDNPKGAQQFLMQRCGVQIALSKLDDFLRKLANPKQKLKMGCTGIAASGSFTTSGDLMHARNFDSSLVGYFDQYPTVVFNNPPYGLKYVGLATAGLPYAGGISGFNEAGIAVSSHEMQTEEYETRYLFNRGVIASYLQNKILENATNIDEAYEIVKRAGHFGAWTIFISDAKTHEIAALELTGKRTALTRRTVDGALGQTNHFLDPTMVGANFEYSYNKTMESRGRLEYVTRELEKGKGLIDEQWMLNMLAGHIDNFVGLRSFGRTVTKAYATASHLMIPARRQFWISLGDAYPVTSGRYVGFAANFDIDKNGQPPFQALGAKEAANDYMKNLPHWSNSLGLYTRAYMDYRDHTKSGTSLQKSYDLVSEAIRLAHQDGIFEFPYYFVRARLGILMAAAPEAPQPEKLVAAADDLAAILRETNAGRLVTHPYELGLANMWLARALDLMPRDQVAHYRATRSLLSAEDYYSRAKDLHLSVAKTEPTPYFLYRVIDSYFDRASNTIRHYQAPKAFADEIDFVTVE